ncbi:hypothetical protein GCM10027435_01130 [Haloparvum alkalitolerans]
MSGVAAGERRERPSNGPLRSSGPKDPSVQVECPVRPGGESRPTESGVPRSDRVPPERRRGPSATVFCFGF